MDESDPERDPSNCERPGYHVESLSRESPVSASVDGYEMRCEPKRIDTGDEITFVLENVSTETRVAYSEAHFLFQWKTASEETDSTCENVFYASDARGYPLGLRRSSPGEIFRWRFTLTEDGQLDPEKYSLSGYSCPPMTTGTYRFVYHGVPGNLPAYPGVEFEVV